MTSDERSGSPNAATEGLELTGGRDDRALEKFAKHHDELSKTRQYHIAGFLLWTNAAFAIGYYWSQTHTKWHVVWRSETVVGFFLAVYLVSLLALVVASPVPHKLRLPEAFRMFAGQGQPPEDSEAWLRTHRRYFYYSGVYLNYTALAILVEQTGGVLKSPFTSVLFVLILGGQQLGRYSTNSKQFFVLGVVLPGVLLVGERYIWTLGSEPSPPGGLIIGLLYAAFIAAALLNHATKTPNFAAVERWPKPEWVKLQAIEQDGKWMWFYSLYQGGRRLDSIVSTDCPDVRSAMRIIGRRYRGIAPIRWRESSIAEAEGTFEYASGRRLDP